MEQSELLIKPQQYKNDIKLIYKYFNQQMHNLNHNLKRKCSVNEKLIKEKL